MTDPQEVMITAREGRALPGLRMRPDQARTCLVLAHGAGAGMRHRAMESLASGLAERGVATLRFDFPFMAAGSKRPDPPPVAQAVVRAAVAAAECLAGDLPVFAGGRSFGGRMTSQAQSVRPIEGVRGLVFFAFPLHPAGRPGIERAMHLGDVATPMLFLQGTNDALAETDLLGPIVAALGGRATLVLAQDADHAFRVPKRSGRTESETLSGLLDSAAAWMADRGATRSATP